MDVLTGLAKGQADPRTFFGQFGGHDAIGSHREVGRYHVSVLDDHDMIDRNPKRRFSAENTAAARYEQVAHAVGVQLTTLGIPCIYYGTEQAFDGYEGYHGEGRIPFWDRYVRESMFGGTFGAFGTAGCHFFDPQHPTYLRIAAIARLVNRGGKVGMALRRGRQYPRDVRFGDEGYVPPRRAELVAWSRVLFDQEVVVVLNTHGAACRGADVTVDRTLHPPGSTMAILYRSDWTDAQLADPPSGLTADVRDDGGRATVRIDLLPAGMAILG